MLEEAKRTLKKKTVNTMKWLLRQYISINEYEKACIQIFKSINV